MPKPDDAVPAAGPRHAGARATHRVLYGVSLAMTAVLTLVGTGLAAAYVDLRSDIDISDVDGLVAGPDPSKAPVDPDDPYAGQELNILVMGTDYRDEANAKIAGNAAGDAGMRSDTTFVVHVSGDRSRIEVVSIPRDSMVAIPACKLPDGSMSQPREYEQFNASFNIGAGGGTDMAYAAACTITTVQALTGLTITNHVILKMTGVIGVVDAIGGVTMCFPEPVHENPNYGTLDLPAGESTLDGRTAIKFLRARHGTGMGLELGSDLTRITRQQAFLNAAQRELKSKNVLTNSGDLYGVVSAVLKSVSADPELADPKALVGLAFSMRNLRPADVIFTELPVVDSTRAQYKVEWLPAADDIWQRLLDDEPPADYVPAPTSSPAATTPASDAGDAGTDDDSADETTDSADDAGETPAEPDDASSTPDATPTETPLPEGICA